MLTSGLETLWEDKNSKGGGDFYKTQSVSHPPPKKGSFKGWLKVGGSKKLMENKTTSELLELLRKLPDEGEKIWGEGGKYEQIMGELRTRYPFMEILDPDWDTSLPAAWEAIK